VPPRPLEEPSRPLNFSPSVIYAALLTAGVILFFVYLGSQLLRYSKPPELTVTNPAVAVLEVEEDDTTFRLAGMTSPGSIVTVAAPGRPELTATAQSSGEWSVQVDLRRGQNRFTITARNPETGKEAETPREVVITVPFLVSQAPTLNVSQPVEGTTYGNGAIAVEGTTTNAITVTVRAQLLGSAPGAPLPSSPPAPTAAPSGAPLPTPEPGTTVDVAEDGSFSFEPLDLTAGRWAITVTATSAEGKTASLTRTITVAYEGVNLVVNIRGGPAWIKVWVDGKLVGEQSGQVYRDGKTLTFSGKTSIEVRTGSSGNTRFTLNGVNLGALGKAGIPETWLFAPPADPVRTQRQ
jgi:hypothetical protein